MRQKWRVPFACLLQKCKMFVNSKKGSDVKVKQRNFLSLNIFAMLKSFYLSFFFLFKFFFRNEEDQWKKLFNFKTSMFNAFLMSDFNQSLFPTDIGIHLIKILFFNDRIHDSAIFKIMARTIFSFVFQLVQAYVIVFVVQGKNMDLNYYVVVIDVVINVKHLMLWFRKLKT